MTAANTRLLDKRLNAVRNTLGQGNVFVTAGTQTHVAGEYYKQFLRRCHGTQGEQTRNAATAGQVHAGTLKHEVHEPFVARMCAVALTSTEAGEINGDKHRHTLGWIPELTRAASVLSKLGDAVLLAEAAARELRQRHMLVRCPTNIRGEIVWDAKSAQQQMRGYKDELLAQAVALMQEHAPLRRILEKLALGNTSTAIKAGAGKQLAAHIVTHNRAIWRQFQAGPAQELVIFYSLVLRRQLLVLEKAIALQYLKFYVAEIIEYARREAALGERRTTQELHEELDEVYYNLDDGNEYGNPYLHADAMAYLRQSFLLDIAVGRARTTSQQDGVHAAELIFGKGALEFEAFGAAIKWQHGSNDTPTPLMQLRTAASLQHLCYSTALRAALRKASTDRLLRLAKTGVENAITLSRIAETMSRTTAPGASCDCAVDFNVTRPPKWVPDQEACPSQPHLDLNAADLDDRCPDCDRTLGQRRVLPAREMVGREAEFCACEQKGAQARLQMHKCKRPWCTDSYCGRGFPQKKSCAELGGVRTPRHFVAAYAHTKEDILSFALLPHNGSCTRLKLTNETLSKRGLPNLVVAVVGDEAVGSYLTKHTLDAYIQKVYGADMGSANNIPRDALASHLLEGLSSAKLAVAGGLQGADASAIEKVERQVI